MSQAYGVKAIHPGSGSSLPHIMGYATARTVANDTLLELWNGSVSGTKVFHVDKDGDISAAAATLSSTLSVTGAATLSSTLAVTGAATLSSTLAVTGAVTLSSTLAVTGVTTLRVNPIVRRLVDTATAAVQFQDSASAALGYIGHSTSTGSGLATGGTANSLVIRAETGLDTHFTSGATIRGTITSAGVFAWTGAATVGGTLGVTGATTLTGALTTAAGITQSAADIYAFRLQRTAVADGNSSTVGSIQFANTVGSVGEIRGYGNGVIAFWYAPLSTTALSQTMQVSDRLLVGTTGNGSSAAGGLRVLGASQFDGALTLGSTLGVTGVATFSGGIVVGTIAKATADGSDNSSIGICGGGAVGSSRGAFVEVHGNESASPGRLRLGAGNVASARIAFETGGAEVGRIDGGDFVWGSAALATSATAGFLFIPSSAGNPTGVPAGSYTGRVPLHYDSVGKKIYIYDGGWIATAALS